MDERLRFVARLLDGEQMAGPRAEFGVSRKTGYKIYHWYKGCGIDGLTDRSRRPQRHANQLPMAIEKLIVRLKREYPECGAPQSRERLQRRRAPVQCPAISTVHAVPDRHGFVKRRSRRRPRARGAPLSWPAEPNALWCADYTREFMLANPAYCYPLTITDFASRYLLGCEAQESTREPGPCGTPCAAGLWGPLVASWAHAVDPGMDDDVVLLGRLLGMAHEAGDCMSGPRERVQPRRPDTPGRACQEDSHPAALETTILQRRDSGPARRSSP